MRCGQNGMAARREVQSIHGLLTSRVTPRAPVRPRRAEQGSLWDVTPERDAAHQLKRVLVRTCTVTSPQAGASEGGTGLPLGCDPADARGPAADAPWPAPLSHPHRWGPCSELRRPLLHAPVRAATRRDGTTFRAQRCCSLLVWAGQTSSLAPSRSSKIVSIAHVNGYEIGPNSW